MKKAILVLFCLILSLVFTACANEEAPPPLESGTPNISTPSEEESGEVELPKVDLS